MIRRPPRSPRPSTPYPYTTLFQSQHPPLDPVARVDDVETVGRGGLESDGRARRSVGHIVTLPPSLRAAKPRGNPALRKPPWIASLRSQCRSEACATPSFPCGEGGSSRPPSSVTGRASCRGSRW